MGLSNAISGGIVMITMVTVVLTLPLLLDSTLSIQDAAIENSKIDDTISKTQMSIVLDQAQNNNNEVVFTISNTGHEKIWNYEKFFLIIEYDGFAGGRYIEEYSYEEICGNPEPEASVGRWCIESFSGDVQDPNILNNGESMTISATNVNDGLDSGGIVIISFSTDNGVVASISTTV